MRLGNIECRVGISEILDELEITQAVNELDLSEFENPEFGLTEQIISTVKDFIVDYLEVPSSYHGITIEVNGEIYLSQYDIDEIDDDLLIEVLEDKGYTLLSSETFKQEPLSGPPQNLFEELCNQFDLPRAATTKQQLIQHINSLL